VANFTIVSIPEYSFVCSGGGGDGFDHSGRYNEFLTSNPVFVLTDLFKGGRGDGFAESLLPNFPLDYVPPQLKPVILAQPASRTNAAGTIASFSVLADGPAPLIYVWQKNGANLSDGGNIVGAASNLLSVANAGLVDAGNYTVVVSNSFGSITSAVAVLTVVLPPVIDPSSGSLGFAGGQFGFDLTGTPGQVVVIEASTDLQQWVPVQTNILGSVPLHFSDPNSSAVPNRYYRAVWLP
jgi:hypothetical protein